MATGLVYNNFVWDWNSAKKKGGITFFFDLIGSWDRQPVDFFFFFYPESTTFLRFFSFLWRYRYDVTLRTWDHNAWSFLLWFFNFVAILPLTPLSYVQRVKKAAKLFTLSKIQKKRKLYYYCLRFFRHLETVYFECIHSETSSFFSTVHLCINETMYVDTHSTLSTAVLTRD